MTLAPENRRQLPLANHPSGRSAMTCQYRCGNACAHPAPNESDNEYFGDIANKVSRRGLLRAGTVGAIVVGAGGAAVAAGAVLPATAEDSSSRHWGTPPVNGKDLTFPAVPANNLDAVIVPNGYDHAVVIRWGDPVEPDAPRFDVTRQSVRAQEKQFGYNNDYVGVLPLSKFSDDLRDEALLIVNHEYTNEELMFPGVTSADGTTLEQRRIAIAAHGMSVVEIERVEETGQWVVTERARRYNRRIHGNTVFELTGPAAGSPLLKTKADPTGRKVRGTFNNCAGGTTPWGTILSGEENFNQYFVGGNGAPEAAKPALNRYGINTTTAVPAGNRKWHEVDERFDLSKHANEANRHGWIVEIDPYDPRSTPVKRTALGRFKHEGATMTVAPDGRVVAYMGDDERFDYIYKFVSDKKMERGSSRRAHEHNMTLLDSGTLYVAKLTGDSPASEIDGTGKLPNDEAFDGSGVWIPLVQGNKSLVPGMSIDEVLVFTRLAADKMQPTKMDRPEDVERNPVDGKIYVALTNNTDRGKAGKGAADEANPRNGNKWGHILAIAEKNNDPTSTAFTWEVPIVCGDPNDPSTYFSGYDKSKVSPISCPDNVAFDKSGNLWISTDGNPGVLGANDGLFAVPVQGEHVGHLKRFLSVPVGAETCGPFITPDDRSVFIAVQHPGEVDDATLDNPASTWPDGNWARPSVVVTWRIAEGNARIGA